jgi:uracil-DNA glycosylase family 4
MSRAGFDRSCTRCELSRSRTQVVPGVGPRKAPLVLVGEAPGKDEDLKGEPFVGRAGRILDDALARSGVSRDRVYITNLVKCRPPGNRRPSAKEAEACMGHLEMELRTVRPKVVCLLGQTAARRVLGDRSAMKSLVGQESEVVLAGRRVRTFVAYHPASCLYRRENVESLRDTVAVCAKAAGLI